MKIHLFKLSFYSDCRFASFLPSMLHHHGVHVCDGLLDICYFNPRKGNLQWEIFLHTSSYRFSKWASVIFSSFRILCNFVAVASSSFLCKPQTLIESGKKPPAECSLSSCDPAMLLSSPRQNFEDRYPLFLSFHQFWQAVGGGCS